MWASILAVVVGVLVLSVAAPASAATFAESGDAGGTRATANVPNVSALTAITGSVSPDSDRDLYKICLSGGQFTAETTTDSDPILGLFDENGAKVAENDEFDPAFSSEARNRRRLRGGRLLPRDHLVRELLGRRRHTFWGRGALLVRLHDQCHWGRLVRQRAHR